MKLTLLHIRNVELGYQEGKKRSLILKINQLEFNAGDFIGVVGLNGSGKSTVLKSISGEIPSLSGEVFIEGKPLQNYDLHELSKTMAIVLTEKIQGFNLTVFDLVASGQVPYTNLFHQLEEKHLQVIEETMTQCGISEIANVPLKALSDGNFQKALIAKALAQQTQILVLDEPGAYLDFGSKHRLFEDLKELSEKQQKCILVSSHDLQLVAKYCNKVLLIYESKAELCSVHDAIKHPAFLAIGGNYL